MKRSLLVPIVLVILIICGCSGDAKRLYLRDAENLADTVELTHPAFSLGEVPARYAEAKNAFLTEAQTPMTYNEFVWKVQKYCASLNDGHTNARGQTRSRFIDVGWMAVGDGLFLLDSGGRVTDSEVVSIGGLPVTDVFNAVDGYYAIENETARERNRTLYSRSRDLLLLSGCVIENNAVSVTINGREGLTESVYKIKNMDINGFYNHFTKVSSKMLGDVFYIDYNVCELGGQLSGVIKRLEQAVSDGVTRVIIDARDNPGGNTEANKALLAAMGMTEPRYGIYLRYSPLLASQWGRDEDGGFVEYPRDISGAVQNPNINLVVLTNENTYSSAVDLGVGVQDGALGTIIGRISSNAPNCYGDILNYTLPDSKIRVSISCKRFLRPDENADPQSLVPDIMVDYNEDALTAALEFLGAE